jgi:hypothetical protein
MSHALSELSTGGDAATVIDWSGPKSNRMPHVPVAAASSYIFTGRPAMTESRTGAEIVVIKDWTPRPGPRYSVTPTARAVLWFERSQAPSPSWTAGSASTVKVPHADGSDDGVRTPQGSTPLSDPPTEVDAGDDAVVVVAAGVETDVLAGGDAATGVPPSVPVQDERSRQAVPATRAALT